MAVNKEGNAGNISYQAYTKKGYFMVLIILFEEGVFMIIKLLTVAQPVIIIFLTYQAVMQNRIYMENYAKVSALRTNNHLIHRLKLINIISVLLLTMLMIFLSSFLIYSRFHQSEIFVISFLFNVLLAGITHVYLKKHVSTLAVKINLKKDFFF